MFTITDVLWCSSKNNVAKWLNTDTNEYLSNNSSFEFKFEFEKTEIKFSNVSSRLVDINETEITHLSIERSWTKLEEIFSSLLLSASAFC
jgi:hypothetical protein